MKTRSTWPPLCAVFVCRFEVKIHGHLVGAALFAPPHSRALCHTKVHSGISALRIAGGECKAAKFSAGSF